MTVAVIVDGASGLSESLAAEWGIRLLPLALAVDGRAVDQSAYDPTGPGRATTSGPSPGAFAAAFEAAPDGAVVVTVASTLSSTHGAAVIAARLAAVPVRIVDSRTAAGGQALVALAAARVAAQGGGVDDVVAAAEEAAGEVRLLGALESLDGLVRSGRVPGLAAAAGRVLNVNPLVELSDGSVHTLRPAFSREAALNRMVEIFAASRPSADAVAQIVALHARSPADAERLLAAASARAVADVTAIEEFGPTLVSITGPGLVGLAWRWLQ